MTNPFVYGEVVPVVAFVDRETELDRLTRDLLAGQKIFLISPRRYGKSSLVRQALRAAERGGALTVEVTVSSYSSYVAFLEGYARALLGVETRLDKARAWMREMLGSVRPEVRLEPDERRFPIPPRRNQEDFLSGQQVARQPIELRLAIDEGYGRHDFAVDEGVGHREAKAVLEY